MRDRRSVVAMLIDMRENLAFRRTMSPAAPNDDSLCFAAPLSEDMHFGSGRRGQERADNDSFDDVAMCRGSAAKPPRTPFGASFNSSPHPSFAARSTGKSGADVAASPFADSCNNFTPTRPDFVHHSKSAAKVSFASAIDSGLRARLAGRENQDPRHSIGINASPIAISRGSLGISSTLARTAASCGQSAPHHASPMSVEATPVATEQAYDSTRLGSATSWRCSTLFELHRPSTAAASPDALNTSTASSNDQYRSCARQLAAEINFLLMWSDPIFTASIFLGGGG